MAQPVRVAERQLDLEVISVRGLRGFELLEGAAGAVPHQEGARPADPRQHSVPLLALEAPAGCPGLAVVVLREGHGGQLVERLERVVAEPGRLLERAFGFPEAPGAEERPPVGPLRVGVAPVGPGGGGGGVEILRQRGRVEGEARREGEREREAEHAFSRGAAARVGAAGDRIDDRRARIFNDYGSPAAPVEVSRRTRSTS